ncbi:MAG: 23S rRNA (pseudouridine(1915)-N(3))-methyltransferase RlmH [Clostridia bacterium]|nr:23S rRNA (pseudouridine(1915)-N(3))-methyltransferase RlmH [Clostridia bacterium]
MKINLIAIGKIKENYIIDGIKEYAKRISRFAEFNLIELPDAPQGKTPDEQADIEGKRLFEKAKGTIIILDGKGKNLSSEGLATYLDKKCTEGVGEFSFLIGGSHGHSLATKQKADLLLSFGAMTFPHQLFRLMLTEQIYRSLSIINKLPYHK